ncbi:MAG TPA: alpha/beta fold hydrolase [Jatrophihabitans sp.]|jgi:pimeloyl-ACP methyl ester carboxylesterase
MPARVRSADGTTLAVHDTGGAGPVIVAVHGYPDDHTVWDGLTALLADDCRVVRYDVRGAGASDVPATRAGYRMPQLVDDLFAVLDHVGEPVHLLGHDWGSIQCWPALTDPRARGRITGFTSISGPSLEHAAVWLRGVRRNPRPRLRQLAHSYYTLLFQLPALPELAVRRGLIDRAVGPRSHADQANGVNLYRANMFAAMRSGRPGRIEVPVHVIAPTGDPFVTPPLATEAPRPFVADLRTDLLPGGHWVVKDDPRPVAALVRQGLPTGGKDASATDR